MKRRACDRCHGLKKSCSCELPCKTCLKYNHTCSFSRPLRKNGRPRTRPRTSSELIGIKKTYSHNGCLNCKVIKRKCDEEWPVCGYCNKRGLSCFVDKKNVKRMETQGPQYRRSLYESQEPKGIPEGSSRISSECFTPEVDDLSILSATHLDLPFSEKERYLFSSLLGTDSENVSSIWKEYRVNETIIELDSRRNEFNTFQEKLLFSVNQSQMTTKEKGLVTYFIIEVSPILFVDKTSTQFLDTIIPLTTYYIPIRNAVISIAASHRAYTFQDNSEYRRDATVFRAKSQGIFLSDNIERETEGGLLSILLLVTHEVLEGTTLYWSVALDKAAEIVCKQGGLEEVYKKAPVAAQLFCYLDMVSSISTCHTPHSEKIVGCNSVYGSQGHKFIESILKSKFGFRFGIGGELFKIIGNISTLASFRKSRHQSKSHDEQFNLFADVIELKLQEWSPPFEIFADSYHSIGSNNDAKLQLTSLTVALQWAAFLRIHQIRHGYNRKDSKVMVCLKLIMRSIKVIDECSELEICLVFPLIMAGSVAFQTEDRAYILQRLRSIKGSVKFNYIQEFEKLLECVWNKDNNENDSVNWASIRYFNFPGLVMF